MQKYSLLFESNTFKEQRQRGERETIGTKASTWLQTGGNFAETSTDCVQVNDSVKAGKWKMENYMLL